MTDITATPPPTAGVEGGEEAPEEVWDPSQLPALPVQPTPVYDYWASPYFRDVLSHWGELQTLSNGGYSRNNKARQDRWMPIVQDRLIHKGNLDQIANLGIDEGDVLTLLYGRPAIENVTHPLEAHELVRVAWSDLSPKGDVAARLPHGMVMVNTVSKSVTRVVTKEDGSQAVVDVKLRFATTAPEMALNHRVTPAGQLALKSATKSVGELNTMINEFPDDMELWANKAQAQIEQLVSAYTPVLERAGLTLAPIKVVPLTAGNGKKAKQLGKGE